MKKIKYIALLLSLMLIACSSGEESIDDNSDKIGFTFQINNFVKGSISKATEDPGSTEEQAIEDLYVFLFPTAGTQTLKKYYISNSVFTGGSWNTADNKVLFNLTQTEAGNREVYVVANCSGLKSSLDAVESLTALQSVLQTNSTPWSSSLNTPILMSGNKTHDFTTDKELNSVPLVRALAKVQLNITFGADHQSNAISQYRYKFIDFDKNTYVLKQTTKTDNLVSSPDWVTWNNGVVTSYTTNNEGKVVSLKLTTYLNERDNSGTIIEVSLPYVDGGLLPPPEFGDETYKLSLPVKIERNNWYVYDVEI